MHSPEGSYCFAQPGHEGQGWSRTAGAEPPQGSPHLWLWGRAGGAGPAWGMWGCFKSRDQPPVGAQPRERGVRAELLHSRCPGPCGRGGSARSPPRGDIRGPSTMPALGRGQATGDCTWGEQGEPRVHRGRDTAAPGLRCWPDHGWEQSCSLQLHQEPNPGCRDPPSPSQPSPKGRTSSSKRRH